MCTNYTPEQLASLARRLQRSLGEYPSETWPGYRAPIIRKFEEISEIPRTLPFRLDLARFGLIAYRVRDVSKVRNTMNARSETIGELWSYKPAWDRSQRCLVPMTRFFEPHYGEGRKAPKSVRWQIWRQDNEPFTVGAIWDKWIDKATGEVIESFSLVTINADGHDIMRQFHRDGDEPRSLVVIPPERQLDWLEATPQEARDFLKPMPVDEFTAAPAPLPQRPKKPKEPETT